VLFYLEKGVIKMATSYYSYTGAPTYTTKPSIKNFYSYTGAPTYTAKPSVSTYKATPAPAPVYNPTPAPTYQPPTTVQPTAGGGGGGGGGVAAYSAPSLDVDLSGIWETAGQMADNEINPQLAEIDRLLQEAGYSAEDSQRAINEAYPVARRSLQKSIYENMVAGEQGLAAMGTGRGGGRQELLARAGEREATGLEGIETQKQREVGAINRALTQYKGQLGSQKTSLIGQRGGLQATYAEQLRGNRFNEAATKASLGLSYAQLAENARQFNTSLEGITTTAPSGQAYATTPGGTSYFLTDADLAALGLGTIGTQVVKKTGTTNTGTTNYAAQIYAGKPTWLQYLQMQRW
jgi:hypothetical protein